MLERKKNSQSKQETKTFGAKRKKHLLANDKQGSTGNQLLARAIIYELQTLVASAGNPDMVCSEKWQTTCNQSKAREKV